MSPPVRRHFTGFTLAALIACDATVNHAINNARKPAATKYQAEADVKAKRSSH